jgi:nucleotide-binding universal stress UspA family protein
MDLDSATATAPSRARDEPVSGFIDAPGADNESIPRRVLVATDTSATSASAERAGVELSARVGASLIFVSVIDPSRLRLPGGLFISRVDQVRSQRESALARIVANARRLDVAAQYLIWEGDPGASVIEAAEAEGVDVIVVGSHDRGPIGRLLLGSVSSYVVDHARRRVVVIRPGQRIADLWPVAAPDAGATA